MLYSQPQGSVCNVYEKSSRCVDRSIRPVVRNRLERVKLVPENTTLLRALPPADWVAAHEAELARIVGQANQKQLLRAASNTHAAYKCEPLPRHQPNSYKKWSAHHATTPELL